MGFGLKYRSHDRYAFSQCPSVMNHADGTLLFGLLTLIPLRRLLMNSNSNGRLQLQQCEHSARDAEPSRGALARVYERSNL